MVSKRMKFIVVFAIVGALLIGGASFVIIEHETISKKLASAFGTRKGTAKWWYTNSSDESKRKGVFVCYYDPIPFEYEDSVFQMKLVFKEVYVEWCHWYEWPDTLERNCLFYKNSDTRKDQQLVGLYDADSCILGFSRILKSNYHDLEGEDIYVDYGDSLRYLVDFNEFFSVDVKRIPLFYWESICGRYPKLIFGRYEYDRLFLGYDTPICGEFPDTIRIPVHSSYGYNKRCGYDAHEKLPFGELVFIKRTNDDSKKDMRQ